MGVSRTPSQKTPIKGRKLALDKKNALMTNGFEMTSPCVDCSIVVSAEDTDVRTITIQLKDADGNDINFVEVVDLFVFGDAGGLSFSAGGSAGIAIGTDGALATVLAKKVFVATSEADGDIDLTWTDSGTAAAFLGVRLPSGRVVVSAALTNT